MQSDVTWCWSFAATFCVCTTYTAAVHVQCAMVSCRTLLTLRGALQVSKDPPEVRIVAQPLPNVLGIKSRFEGPEGEEITVEQLALQHYATPDGGGWTGVTPTAAACPFFDIIAYSIMSTPMKAAGQVKQQLRCPVCSTACPICSICLPA